MGCPAAGTGTADYVFSATKSGGLSTNGGVCRRTPTNFTKISFTSTSGGTAWASTFYAVHTGEFMITPPIQNTEYQPIFTVHSMCPVANKTVNWLYVQWNDGAVVLTNTYLLGTAAITTTGNVTVNSQYDINGSVYWSGAVQMPGSGGCSGGITDTPGTDNLGGRIFWTANDGGVYKTATGRATFFLPSQTVSSGDFASGVFQGITFDSSTSLFGIYANASEKTKNIRGVANAAGTIFTVQPYSDPEIGTIDSVSAYRYTDTLTFTAFNSPNAGMIRGTVTRTGPGAVNCGTCTGRLACMARTSGGSGTRIICSGESPLNNTIPYNITLFKPYVCPVGYVLVPKDTGVNSYDDFCIAKYEMQNIGGVATSQTAGSPWVNIDVNTAIAQCRALGSAYDLVTNVEWQTVARNIEDTYEIGKYLNWTNGSKSGTNSINRGHSDNSPADALAASTDGDDCFGTGQTFCLNPLNPDFTQKRTHKLNTGGTIWDFSGNVSEWVRNNNLSAQGTDGFISFESWISGGKTKWGPRNDYTATGANPKTTAPYGGLGYGSLNYSAGGLIRGGSRSDLTSAGVFNTDLSIAATSTSPNVGFRCVYHTAPVQDSAALNFTQGSWAPGSVVTNTTATSGTLTLINNGFASATLATTPYAITGTGMSLINNLCPAAGGTLLAGASCTMEVRFSPTTVGAVTGTLTINWTSPGLSGPQNTQMILSATGVPPPNISMVPNPLVFGNIANGATTTSVLTINNSGGFPATVVASGGLSVTGSQFTLSSNTCGWVSGVSVATIAAGGSCTMTVGFSPTGGTATGTPSVIWTYTGAPGNTTTSNANAITGTGVTPPSLAITPATFNFGSVTNGTTTSTNVFTVTNSGATPANLIAAGGFSSSNSQFTLIGNTCGWVSGTTPGTVAANGSCTVTVQFTPTGGAASATLSATSNYTGSAGNTTVSTTTNGITGTGISPASLVFSANFTAGDVTIGTSVTSAMIQLTNTGQSTATLGTPWYTMFGTDMSLVVGTCANGVILASGASCTVQVRYAPVYNGPVTGTLTAAWTSPGLSGIQLSDSYLSGWGRSPASISQSPSSYTFSPATTIGTIVTNIFTITNNGQTATSNLYFSHSGAGLTVASTNCPTVLGAGLSCTATLQYAPPGVATLSGAFLMVNYTGAGVSGTAVTLSTVNGSGVTPASLAYSSGVQVIGLGGGISEAVSYPSGTLTIINNGGSTARNLDGYWGGPNGLDYAFPSTVLFPGTGGSCVRGGTLAPGGICSVVGILRTPGSTSSRTAILHVTYNANNNNTGATDSVGGYLLGALTAPVYRMYYSGNGDHLYTLTAGEGSPTYVAELGGLRAWGVAGDGGACTGGATPLYRCTLSGFHYVGGGSCDQGGSLEYSYGYACTTSTPGTVPLYRNKVGSNYNSSTSIAEGNNTPFLTPVYVHP